MLVTPIFKNGDRLSPANYRPILLLSIPGKIFNRFLLDRMKLQTEKRLRESQFGFRPGRGTVDAIFVTRQIFEKAREHNIQVNMNFIDFKAAFDTIWQKALWKMMISFGIDGKIIRIIKSLYQDTECAVVIDSNITEWFSVKVGVSQECSLSQLCSISFLTLSWVN